MIRMISYTSIAMVLSLSLNLFAQNDSAVKTRKNKSGVTSFDFAKNKAAGKSLRKLPKLDIPIETTVRLNTPSSGESFAAVGLKSVATLPPLRLPVLNVRSSLSTSKGSVLTPSQLPNSLGALEAPKDTTSKLSSHTEAVRLRSEESVEVRKFYDYSQDELDLLRAIIEIEGKETILIGMAKISLLLQKKTQNRDTILFHYGNAAWRLGLLEESRLVHRPLLKSKNSAIRLAVVEHLILSSRRGEKDLVADIESARALIPDTHKMTELSTLPDRYKINLARNFDEKGDISNSLNLLMLIERNSPLYAEARFLGSIIHYRINEIIPSEDLLKEALNAAESLSDQEQLLSSIALTYARLMFQTGKYTESNELYLKVKKSHPEWPQAMMEKSWSQILLSDFEGAAGNMFSLHTDFFKHTFAPESYLVRTVGYLNLCQFGDGIKALKDFKNRYAKMNQFLAQTNKNSEKELILTQEIRKLAQSKKGAEDLTLPKMVVIELARNTDYLRMQNQINQIADEDAQYDKMMLNLISLERSLNQNHGELADQLRTYKDRPPKDTHIIGATEEKLNRIKLDLQTLRASRKAMKQLKTDAQTRYEEKKSTLKLAAEKVLNARLKVLSKTLSHDLDQSDVLSYELFAGASIHLRKEMEQDTVKKEEIAKNEKTKEETLGKGIRWKFQGEIWEDELGHFRSSLKNACGQSEDLTQQAQLN